MKSSSSFVIMMRLSTCIIVLLFALLFLLAFVWEISSNSSIASGYLATFIVRIYSQETHQNRNYGHLPLPTDFNVNFTCDDVLKGKKKAVKSAKKWQYKSKFRDESQLLDLLDDCSRFKRHFSFPRQPLSTEEADFPLGYGLIVYKHPEQVIRMLSSVYWPQNLYCLTYDAKSSRMFKEIMKKIPKCFPNILIPKQHFRIDWCGYGVLQAAMSCLNVLTARKDSKWRYFQYLSGSDVPLKTNLEMVRIFKALNGSFNSEISELQKARIWGIRSPPPANLTVFKSSFSATFSRESAEVIVRNNISREYFKWLKDSYCPDETFWSTVAGNPKIIQMPGGFPGESWLQQKLKLQRDHNMFNFYYISRYQVWPDTPNKSCFGYWSSGSCVFGVDDLPALMKRAELIAHKLYLNYQPAAYFCLLEALKKRALFPEPFDIKFYSNLPGPRYIRSHNKDEIFLPFN